MEETVKLCLPTDNNPLRGWAYTTWNAKLSDHSQSLHFKPFWTSIKRQWGPSGLSTYPANLWIIAHWSQYIHTVQHTEMLTHSNMWSLSGTDLWLIWFRLLCVEEETPRCTLWIGFTTSLCVIISRLKRSAINTTSLLIKLIWGYILYEGFWAITQLTLQLNAFLCILIQHCHSYTFVVVGPWYGSTAS